MQAMTATLINVLILSSAYILVAVGFAFFFNTLGILNFAHGAIYMVAGYLGYLFIVGFGLNQWIGLLLTILTVGAFGVFLEKYCFRPFAGNFNRIVMVCIAVTLVFQTTINITVGTRIMVIPSFGEGVLRIGPVSVSYERLITFLIGAIVVAAITWFVNRTKWGHQMQAVAQNMEATLLQGINVHHISALASALACGLAALAGVLMGAYLRLGPFVGDSMLLKALILVILAGAGSFGGIFAAGLILGVLDAVLPAYLGGAISDAAGVVIVIILLLIRPKGFFGHEVEMVSEPQESQSTPEMVSTGGRKWGKPTIYAGLVMMLALLPLWADSPYTLHVLILYFIYVVTAVSLRTITISGQFPVGHCAFMGLGAYLSGVAAKLLGWTPWITIPSAAVATAGIGILIGYPFSRLRTVYYAMGSLFFGVGVILIIAAGGDWTGSYGGLPGIPPLLGFSKVPYYYFFLGLSLVCLIALHRFEFCRIGTTLKAIAQSHLVASSVGISESFYRILAVGVGCFFVGLVGAAYAHYNLVVAPDSFNLTAALWFIMYVLIGGINSFAGPIIGTVVLFLIPELFLRDLKMYTPYISAGILLLAVYLAPEGLAGLPRLIRLRSIERRKEKKAGYAS